MSDFWMSEEPMASDLKLLAQMGASEQLKFRPMDIFHNMNCDRKDFDCRFG
jgi:hypothetical protein